MIPHLTGHIFIICSILILMTGISTIVYCHQRSKSYTYAFLRPIMHHTIIYNFLVIILFMAKYSKINLPENFLLTHYPNYAKIGNLFSTLILDGKSNKEIEDSLFISYHTVKNHVYKLYQKLGVKTRFELVHFFTKYQNQVGEHP